MPRFIQINKFSKLHNNIDIIFNKYHSNDNISELLTYVKKLDHNVVLITGNSDYPVHGMAAAIPHNVTKWFAQNALANHDKLEPIPIGLENKLVSEIGEYHGVGYPRVQEKEDLLSRNIIKQPSKLVYANFNVNTNLDYRQHIRQACIQSSFIDWEEPVLSISELFDKFLDYKMVVCPVGNGIDTHRLWEVLYSKRIPITIKVGDFKIYKLYEKFPIIVLDHHEQLLNHDIIMRKYEQILVNKYDWRMLDVTYWENKMLCATGNHPESCEAPIQYYWDGMSTLLKD